MVDMAPLGSGRTRLQFRIPARGLVGFRNEFLTITRGEGIMSSQFDGYEPWFGYIPRRNNGAIISDRQGDTVPYALFSIQERGQLFVGARRAGLRGHDHRRERRTRPTSTSTPAARRSSPTSAPPAATRT